MTDMLDDLGGVLGVDLSLTGTGLVFLHPDHKRRDLKLNLGIPLINHAVHDLSAGALMVRVQPDSDPFLRWKQIRNCVLGLAAGCDRVVMENYAFGSPFGREALAELGGIIKFFLKERLDITPTLIAPMTLKKFATGTGKAQKDLVLKEVYKRWHVDVDDNNIADAFVLAKIAEGLAYCKGDMPQFQRDILEQIESGPKKKVKKAKR